MRRVPLCVVLGAALALLPVGCAKGPSGSPNGGSITGKLLTLSLTVRGQLDLANDYYYICFNVGTAANPTGIPRNGFNGPVPVVTDFERGGNGFAGGAFTTFIECHQGQPQGANFSVNAISPDLLTPSYIAQPIQTSVTGNTFTIQIPISDIASASTLATGSTITAAQITSLQVNFIATNVTPVNPQDTTTKYFDALGNPAQGQLNAFVTIPTAQNTTYQNGTFGQEPSNDVATYVTVLGSSQTDFSSSVQIVPDQSPAAIANLDIVNWSVTFSG